MLSSMTVRRTDHSLPRSDRAGTTRTTMLCEIWDGACSAACTADRMAEMMAPTKLGGARAQEARDQLHGHDRAAHRDGQLFEGVDQTGIGAQQLELHRFDAG